MYNKRFFLSFDTCTTEQQNGETVLRMLISYACLLYKICSCCTKHYLFILGFFSDFPMNLRRLFVEHSISLRTKTAFLHSFEGTQKIWSEHQEKNAENMEKH